MLRTITKFYLDAKAVDIYVNLRRDFFKKFHAGAASQSSITKTVLVSSRAGVDGGPGPERPPHAAPPPPPPPPPPQPPRQSWPVAAAAAFFASLAGVYFYSRLKDEELDQKESLASKDASAGVVRVREPALPERLPTHVQYLLVGGGTAAFAAFRAIKTHHPTAQVLVVSEESVLPYMRPPLSKELWQEAELAARAADPHSLTFRQWNGKRRGLVYESRAFYAPPEELAAREGGGVAVARGWRVARLHAERRADLEAVGEPALAGSVTFDKCLVATGSRAARARGEGAARALVLRDVEDAARLAARLRAAGDGARVAVIGGGFLATELAASLALAPSQSSRADGVVDEAALAGAAPDSGAARAARVWLGVREARVLQGVLPEYLSRQAEAQLSAAGVTLLHNAEVLKSEPRDGGVLLHLSTGETLQVDAVVEATGSEPNVEVAAASGLELHPELGGVVVNDELQARSHVYAAGDVACFYDPLLGRRRVEHHDHAVVSGRLAGYNMAAALLAESAPGDRLEPKRYRHQSMFWSDLGPRLGYEAIGVIDSRLPTVGVFADAAESTTAAAAEGAGAEAEPEAAARGAPADEGKFDRGVVFYLRGKRVVGVLLWNLFNRMHLARQVLAQGEFEDLNEVAKLFTLYDD